MNAQPQTVDAFELLQQLRAAAEPLGLVVELRPADTERHSPPPGDGRPAVTGPHTRLAVVDVLNRQGGVWMAPAEIAAALDLPAYRLVRSFRMLVEDGSIESNGKANRARRYRAAESSTPNDGDGEAEQAAATPVEGAGPDGRDPSPGDPADTNAAAAAGSPASIEDRASDKGDVAAEASPTPSAPPVAKRAVPLRADLVPRVSGGAATVEDRVRQSFAEDGPGTVSEVAARLRDAGYAKCDVAAAIFKLHERGEVVRRTVDGGRGASVYRSAR